MRNLIIAAMAAAVLSLTGCAVNVITVQSAVIGIDDNATTLSADVVESNVGNSRHE